MVSVQRETVMARVNDPIGPTGQNMGGQAGWGDTARIVSLVLSAL